LELSSRRLHISQGPSKKPKKVCDGKKFKALRRKDTIKKRVLYRAFELNQKEWKPGFCDETRFLKGK
jgi:hypothetical protein